MRLILLLCAGALLAGTPPEVPIASFAGSGQDSIQSMAKDGAGNLYIAGTTTSIDFPVTHAFQPRIAGSRVSLSTDAGDTWTNLANPPEDLNLIVQDPGNPQVLFGAGNHIFRSADGGRSWSAVFTDYQLPIPSLVVDPANDRRVAAISYHGVNFSLDNGQTWTLGFRPYQPASSCLLAADPFGSGTLLVSCPEAIYISHDWGATAVASSLKGAAISAYDPFHPGWIYSESGTSIQTSTDGGNSWTAKTPIPAFHGTLTIDLVPDPDQPDTWYVATVNGTAFVTHDAAVTWSPLPAAPAVLYNRILNTGLAAVSRKCSGGGLFANDYVGTQLLAGSHDFGITWKPVLSVEPIGLSASGCNLWVAAQLLPETFVAKVTPDGQVAWATYLGGPGQQTPIAVLPDAAGNVQVIGFATGGAGGDISIAKYDPAGTLVTSSALGGTGVDRPLAATLDGNGSVYIAGTTQSSDFPFTPGGSTAQLPDGGFDGFLLKLGTDEHLVYATNLGANVRPSATAVDAAGQAIVSGVIEQTFPRAGFLWQFNAAGSQVIHQSTIDAVTPETALAIDSQRNIYLAGTTANPNFPVTPGAFLTPVRSKDCSARITAYPPSDIFISKLSPSDLHPLATALLGADCGSTVGALQATQGVVTLAVATAPGFPLKYPQQSAATCLSNGAGGYAGAFAQLAGDLSSLLFSTYVNACTTTGPPIAALAADVDVALNTPLMHTEVVDLSVGIPPRRPPFRN